MNDNALNDGFLIFGTDESIHSAKGKAIGERFERIGRLAYQELSCRDEDYVMAQNINSSVLNLKVRTLFPPILRKRSKTNLKVIIDNVKYDVIKTDSDQDKRYLYFYLQEVGTFEQDNTVDE